MVITEKQFFKKLEELPKKGWWPYLTYHKKVRLKEPRGKREFCPVTAVCFEMTGIYYSAKNYDSSDAAGRDIGLKRPRVFAVSLDYENEEEIVADGSVRFFNLRIRRRMIKALGLSEESKWQD